MRTACVLLFALPLLAQDPSRGVNFYSYEKEQALGRQLADEYRRSATLIESPELVAHIESMARPLIPAGSRHTYTFALVADTLPRNEPVALPGGWVFVPAGLIRESTDSRAVAAMLAHAIAHVEARHGTKQATRGEIVNYATVPLIFMGGATAVPMGFRELQEQFEAQADSLGAGYLNASTAPIPDLAELQRLLPPVTPEKPKNPPRLAR